jgi:phosphate transport system substrate-binding protein
MRRAVAGLLAAAWLASATPAAAPGATRTITMSGSTPTAAVTADLAYFYRRQVRRAPRFSIVGGGTGTGIADAARGIVDAGLASRALGPDDPRGLVLTPIALSGVCIVSNRGNPLPGIDRGRIQDLVAGRLTSWTQVPGSTRTDAIAPVALDERAGARSVFLSVFVDLATPLLYRPRTLATAAQMRDYVRATPAALGYVDLAFARELHAIRYEGVPCTRATIRAGTYPASRPLGFVTRGRPNRAVRGFVRWIRRSRTARRVIATRYVPTTPGSSGAPSPR